MTTYQYDSSFQLTQREIEQELNLQWNDEIEQNYNPNPEYNPLRDFKEYRFE